ncbi:Phytanoyl-CoA dioxygenase [hydrothermal vent metagenome]|uniref:Phytanoyl-CoA dioxygenase n=1 Tax=hydrothermal vent metagenome TaxID=652676 RepID=A0A1W1CB68_9ZZZZ
MQLTTEQLDSFNTNGFLIIRSFADKAKCEAILDVAKVHLKHKIEPIETEIGYRDKSKDYRRDVVDYNSKLKEDTPTVRRLRQVYFRDILFKEWMEDREIRPILEQILNDQVVITTAHHNSIMTKMPYSSTETGWHQDRRYWHFSDDNLLSVWLALDYESSENGVLEFIPKSHKMSFEPEQFDEKEYFRTDYSKNMSLIETAVSTTLQRGDIVLFHSLLLHRANANRTDKPKIAFVYTVKGASTKAIEGTRSSEYPEICLKNS